MFTSSPILRWRKYNEKYFLEGNQCLDCKKIHYPTTYLCSCGSQKFKTTILSGHGKIYSFTQVTIPPTAFIQQAPYCLGIIELKEGPKILAQITDIGLENLIIGQPVQASFRKLYTSGNKGIIHYGIKFIPTEN